MNTREATHQYRMNQWAQKLHERKMSGESITAWCDANGVSRNTYFYWQKRLRERACEELAHRSESAVTVAPMFAEVKLNRQESSESIVVRLNGAEIAIKDGTSAELVASVLKTLQQLC